MDVLCVGLAVFDQLVRDVEHNLMDVDCVYVDDLQVACGGDALNAAVNCANMGMDTALVARIGTDANGDFLLRYLEKKGIDTRYMARNGQYPTSTTIVCIEPSGERHFMAYGKSNQALTDTDIPKEAIKSARHVHVASVMSLLGLSFDKLENLLRTAKAHGATTSFDVNHDRQGHWLRRIDAALHYTDIFIPSHYEAQVICGGLQTPEEMKAFFAPYGLKVFGLKMGAKGVYLTDYKQDIYLPSLYEGKPVDTTGAGDAFFASFISGYLRGMCLADCGVLGSAASAMVIGQVGATTGLRPFKDALKLAAARGYPITTGRLDG
nr:carbohydrate kinase family protein [Maliibacterium massiliense]